MISSKGNIIKKAGKIDLSMNVPMTEGTDIQVKSKLKKPEA